MNKITKYIGALLIALSVGIVSYGKPVDENTAKKIGSNFLISSSVPGVNTVADITTSYVAAATISGKSVNTFYVFNIVGAKGFVIISADDNVIPILAWSDESSFDISIINPEAKFWIDGYKNKIANVIANNTPAQPGTVEKWNDLKSAKKNVAARTTAVTPLLGTIAWDQAPGYNNQCPSGTGGRAVTGCVATCMAEIMRFWKWPTIGCGAHTYTPTYIPLPGYGYSAQTADFGNTAYNWTGMPNSGSAASNSAAVQLLMHHAGIAVDMMYGPISSPTGSGAYVSEKSTPFFNGGAVHTINCAEFAMKAYFHYKRSLRGVARTDGSGATVIPDATWISMIEAELNAGRPVMYSGSGSDGGHCWVCDGWQASSSTFHFNFGWSGSFNGYYSINNVDPGPGGTGGGAGVFNDFQDVVIGIQPDSFPSNPGNIQMLSHLDCTTNSPIQYLSPFSVTAKILNANSSTFNGDFCAQVFDTANTMLGTIQTITGQTINTGDSSALLTFATSTGINGMIPETYFYIRIMYRPTGTSTWIPVANNNTFINYNAIDVRNSQIFSINQNLEIYQALNVTPGTTITSGGPLTVTTKIASFSSSDFNGTFRAVLINVATGTQFTIQQFTGQNLTAGHISSVYTLTNSNVNVGSGTYVLAIQHQNGGTGASYTTGSDFYSNPVIIKVNGSVGIPTAPSVADQVAVYPNPASDLINIDFHGITAKDIWITDIQGRTIQKISGTVNNQSVITVPVVGYAPGMYFVNMQTENELVSKKVIIK